ncbi:Deoxycytidine monophosphate (dCMP) deaminase [Arachnomyces sp. PD_36]|nr:Deoxycytidine monophosphate (dCMP) deaminase [Arachnomyces sp. PD_36]
MLIGLCGGICAGKHSVAEHLIQKHGFQRLQLDGSPYPTIEGTPDDELRLKATSLEPTTDSKSPRTFHTISEMLEFVTPRWRERWITTDLWDASTLDQLLLRPFFLLVSVDAPVSLRWKRFSDRCRRRQLDPPDLEKFVLWNDQHLYHREIGRASLTDRAQVRLFNSLSSLEELHKALDILDISNEQRLRPGWDQYFMQLASLAAQRSNCMKRRVGCVLVREGRVISTGYNGTPRNTKNCNEGGCARCNGGQGGGAALSTCLCIHAEENALLEAGRERIREGATLYCNTCPCLTCSVKIAQMGLSEVVYSQSYNMDNQTAAILKEAGVGLRQFSPPRNGLIYLQDSTKITPDSI